MDAGQPQFPSRVSLAGLLIAIGIAGVALVGQFKAAAPRSTPAAPKPAAASPAASAPAGSASERSTAAGKAR